VLLVRPEPLAHKVFREIPELQAMMVLLVRRVFKVTPEQQVLQVQPDLPAHKVSKVIPVPLAQQETLV
jgi:hypothetical protein